MVLSVVVVDGLLEVSVVLELGTVVEGVVLVDVTDVVDVDVDEVDVVGSEVVVVVGF